MLFIGKLSLFVLGITENREKNRNITPGGGPGIRRKLERSNIRLRREKRVKERIGGDE